MSHRLPTGARVVLALLLAWPTSASGAAAPLELAGIFGDHMVLQQGRPMPVWGRAAPEASVTVTLCDATGEAFATAAGRADAAGSWRVELPPLQVGGPFVLRVVGDRTLELQDVLVGEVWFASGQSNMEWELRLEQHAAIELPRAEHPGLRLYKVPRRPAGAPRDDVHGEWVVCTPESVQDFSAVAYYFGERVHAATGRPVGLIAASWGGTPIETWTPRAALDATPAYAPLVQRMRADEAAHRRSLAARLPGLQAWSAAARRALHGGDAVPPMPLWPDAPFAADDLPTGLFNGMVHPVAPYALAGFLWYQGENNRGDGLVYADKQRALIAGWRDAWHDTELPFYFVQLAPFRYTGSSDLLAEIREAQRRTLDVPHTGMAVTTDVGDVDDIHPRNKRDVGRRLARWALARDYGQDLVISGPLVRAATAEGPVVRVQFDWAVGLTTRDGAAPNAFELAGSDGAFVPATAVVDGESVQVQAAGLAHPLRVRFGWDALSTANLVNAEGLPAAPFDVPVTTR